MPAICCSTASTSTFELSQSRPCTRHIHKYVSTRARGAHDLHDDGGAAVEIRQRKSKAAHYVSPACRVNVTWSTQRAIAQSSHRKAESGSDSGDASVSRCTHLESMAAMPALTGGLTGALLLLRTSVRGFTMQDSTYVPAGNREYFFCPINVLPVAVLAQPDLRQQPRCEKSEPAQGPLGHGQRTGLV